MAVFEEGGDLSLGIPFDKATQALVAEEREVLAGCISAAARAAVTLIEPEDGHYLTIAKASVTAASEDIFDELASEAERLLWTPASAGEVVVGASVDMYDTEVYDTYASIRQS